MAILSRTAALVSLLLACPGLAGSATGQEPAPEPDEPAAPVATVEETEFQALLVRLTVPLQPELVRQAIRHPQAAVGESAQGLCAHLTAQGGIGAAQGLLALADHSRREVRAAALRGLATLGLHIDGAAEAARDALRDFAPEVHLAAIAALGVLGGAGDLDQLLELLQDDDRASQVAAFRALRALTGARNANDARIWSYWCGQTRKELPQRFARALQLLTDGGGEAESAEARRLLAQSAWFDRGRLEDAAREWLAASMPQQRIEAFRLVTAARLATLADEVQQAVRAEEELIVRAFGVECEVALGLRAPAAAAELVPTAQPPR